jgi:hypothetical protein
MREIKNKKTIVAILKILLSAGQIAGKKIITVIIQMKFPLIKCHNDQTSTNKIETDNRQE